MTPSSEESAAYDDPHERSSSEAQSEVIHSKTNSSQNLSDMAMGTGTTTAPGHHQTNSIKKHHRHHLRRHHHRHNHGNRSRSRLPGLRGVHKKHPRKNKLVPRRRPPGRCRAAVLKGNLWIRPVAMTAIRGPVPLLFSSTTAAMPIFSFPQERQGLDERGLVDLLPPAWLDDNDALLPSSPGVTADSPRARPGQARTIFGESGKPIESRPVCGKPYFPVTCAFPQIAPSA